MKKNNIIITIGGTTGVGKSTMMYQVEKLLKENGFDVELSFHNHPDYSGENTYFFNEKESKNFDKKIEAIKENTTITLQEKQLKKLYVGN